MLFASNNQGKVLEVEKILNKKIMSLKDIKEIIEIDENKDTFLENAILKAKEIYKITNIPTIADDSGLEIDALNGFPGVLTNRFLGKNKTDSEKNQEILKLMKDKKNRTCYFTCAIAYYDGVNLLTYEEKLEGKIAKVENINQGFGFDSIFLYNDKYLSDMSIFDKNKISPRQIALTKLAKDEIFLKKDIDLIN